MPNWDEPLHKRILTLYKSFGFSQKQIAIKLGMDRKTLSELFNKKDAEFTYGDITNLCSALEISVFDLFNHKDFYPTNSSRKPFCNKPDDYFHNAKIKEKYEIVEYDHAGTILQECYRSEYEEIKKVLLGLNIDIGDCERGGGNESPIPKKIRKLFRDQAWYTEQQIDGSLLLDLRMENVNKKQVHEFHNVNGYLTGYHLDYYKSRIAVDTEWNSKDQTFDRDLSAMRAYYEAGVISLGVIITRGDELGTFPEHYGFKKYGASTTWMKKLTDRLDSRRAGGCPILAIGIKPEAINNFITDKAYLTRNRNDAGKVGKNK